MGKPVTKSKGWKLEQKSKLGREQEDYSYSDLFLWRPFYSQTWASEHSVLERRAR